MPDESPKRLIVVGDRVLIAPEEGEERTNVGLYLPPSALEGRQVQGGRIVAHAHAPDHVDLVAEAEEKLQRLAEDVVVLDEDDAYRFHSAASNRG